MGQISRRLDMSGKVVMITGGASGMGVGITRCFAEAGADVIFTCLKHAENAETLACGLRDLGVRAEYLIMDQSSVDACRSGIDAAVSRMKRIDVLVNNSGLHGGTPTMQLDETTWDTILNCNLRGSFFCAQEAAKHMIQQGQGGSIINISSINSVNPLENALHYGASKAGIEMHTRCLAKELGQYNIRVNAIAPGLIESAILDRLPGLRERFVERAPLSRPGTPEDIGNICLFLASDMSSWITGQIIIADGGVTLAACY